MNRGRAFTQIEILVAVAVLSVGLLAVMGVLALGLRSSRYSQAHTASVGRARQAVELIRSRDWAFDSAMVAYFQDSPGERTPLEYPPFEDDFPPEGYSRNILIERLSSDPNSFESSIARIRVSIYYKDRGGERRLQLESWQRQP